MIWVYSHGKIFRISYAKTIPGTLCINNRFHTILITDAGISLVSTERAGSNFIYQITCYRVCSDRLWTIPKRCSLCMKSFLKKPTDLVCFILQLKAENKSHFPDEETLHKLGSIKRRIKTKQIFHILCESEIWIITLWKIDGSILNRHVVLYRSIHSKHALLLVSLVWPKLTCW